MLCKYRKTNTPWHLGSSEELEPPLLKQQLLEKMGNSEVAQRRFWKKVQKKGPNDCWEWKGAFKQEYGTVVVVLATKRVELRAHRIAYFLENRKISPELCVCHSCDNPKCCNPKHLFLRTSPQNTEDRHLKQRDARGETSNLHKLTEKEVTEIRRLFSSGEMSGPQIARIYGVHRTNIWHIMNRTWKHLK